MSRERLAVSHLCQLGAVAAGGIQRAGVPWGVGPAALASLQRRPAGTSGTQAGPSDLQEGAPTTSQPGGGDAESASHPLPSHHERWGLDKLPRSSQSIRFCICKLGILTSLRDVTELRY